jgi:hypothetical protein
MTEQSIIERAARALQETWNADETLPPIEFSPAEAAALVRAVLTAIREPSEAVIEAGLAECSADWRESVCREFLPDIWKAMIDAALVAAFGE